METTHRKEKIRVLIFIVLITCIAFTLVKPITQDERYHNFADGRVYFSIPNFWNVISNLPYLIFGGLALAFHFFNPRGQKIMLAYPGYAVFFVGVVFTCFGSAYYHAWPNTQTLVWDRLPMTIAFMGFFAAIIGQFIDKRYGKILLAPLVLLGIFSVLYWRHTEQQGRGDLRLYAIVQYLPMLLIPLIIIFFKNTQVPLKFLWYAMFSYLIAKFFEAGDRVVFENTPFLSGHTLKHFAAGIAPMFVWLGLLKSNKEWP